MGLIFGVLLLVFCFAGSLRLPEGVGEANRIKDIRFKSFFSYCPYTLERFTSVDIRSIDDVNKFKSKLKTFLFKRVYEL